MKLLTKILLVIFFLWLDYGFANINLSVSPIKYEIIWGTWDTIVKTAILYNKWANDINIITWKSDFIASWTDWSPTFVRYSELVHQDQQLSSWINLSSTWFTIPAHSEKEISFSITIPENATPGWHYWAVFFKNNNSESSNSNWVAVWINVDYWIIILLKVEWKVLTNIIVDNNNITIKSNSSHSGNFNPLGKWNTDQKIKKTEKIEKSYNLIGNWTTNSLLKKDNCLLDFTDSRFDWKCFDNPKAIIKIIKWDNKDNIIIDNTTDNFNISFKIPIDNKWNTHVKTKWEIHLFDENWKQIKQIWKKIIVNEKWAILREDIVDYLPINDNRWNILPWTKRIFEPEWKGFPFKKRDDNWNIVIDYKTPWEYYSDKSAKEDTRLFPWERICYDKKTKKITAKFNISYINDEWKEISYPSAKEFNVSYTRKYIWYNYYLIFLAITVIISLFIFLYLLFWLIWILKKRNKKEKKKNKKKNKK